MDKHKDEDENAVNTIAELEAARGMRGQYEATWDAIAERILPSYAKQFQSQGQNNRMPGTQYMAEMVDATGANALIRFAAAMESMLTPRNSKWHSLVPSDRALMKDRETRIWFEEVTRVLFQYRYAPKANYASQKHEDYMMLGAFGTGAIFIDALQDRITKEKGIRYRATHLGQNYFLENHQGIIDKNLRKFEYTARQAVQKFGPGNLPEIIVKKAAEPKSANEMYEFIHKVAPREDYDPERKDKKGMPYYACYVSVTGKCTVEETGYTSFPFSISRYVTAPGEVYGRSPAMMALPALRAINEMKKTVIKQGHRTVDPVLLMHDDGILDSFSLTPGAANAGAVTEDGKLLVHTLPTGNLAVGKDMMDAEAMVINDFFLVTLFQILVDTPQMTATEVIERAREKGALLSPTMGRQQSESLGPQIEREIDVLIEQGLIPPMPPALLEANGEYTVQYDSPLSRMARAEEASGLMRMMDHTINIVKLTGDPAPMDWYNFDTIMPELADIHAVPVSWMNSQGTVDAKRKQRAEQAQQAQMIEAAPAAAAIAKQVMPPPQKAPA
jgi:hypothetical protein